MVKEQITELIKQFYPDLKHIYYHNLESFFHENIHTFDSAKKVKESVEKMVSGAKVPKNPKEMNDFCTALFNLSELSKPRLIKKGDKYVEAPKPLTDDEKAALAQKENEELISKIKIEHKPFSVEKKSEKELFSFEDFSMTVGDKLLFKNVNFSIEDGKRYGFVGINGTGKSLLLKAFSLNLFKFARPFTYALVEEELARDDTKVINCFVKNKDEEALMNEFKEYYQKPTSKKAVRPAPSNRMVVLNGLGLTDAKMDYFTSQLSGGWRMKISLAKCLLEEPDLLLLDEPSNMLDAKTITWLHGHLKNWKKSLLFISHDKGFLDICATDIINACDKTITPYACGHVEFAKRRVVELADLKAAADAQRKQKLEMNAFIKKFQKTKIDEVKAKQEILDNMVEINSSLVVKEVWSFPACHKIKCATIETMDMSFNYKSNMNILNNVKVRIEPDSKICILGDNGCGKTTLLKLFMQILKPSLGNVYVHPETNVGYFSQHYIDQLDLDMTSIEIIRERYPTCSADLSKKNLLKFGITEEDWDKPIKFLSSGQKSRVAFALIYMKKPNFLIMDEPTSHLDASGTEALEDALRKFKGGVILVTHDGRMMTNVCNDLWYITGGTLSTIKDGCVM